MRNERDARFDREIGAWFGKSKQVTQAEMKSRVWRFAELVPSYHAFLDCSLPGHVRTLYSALGGGADEEQLEGTAVEQAVNYHIDFVKALPGIGAALHSHGSEETFIALTGRWKIYWGDDGVYSVILETFDEMVVPDGVIRAFRNVSEAEAVLMTVLNKPTFSPCPRCPPRCSRRPSPRPPAPNPAPDARSAPSFRSVCGPAGAQSWAVPRPGPAPGWRRNAMTYY